MAEGELKMQIKEAQISLTNEINEKAKLNTKLMEAMKDKMVLNTKIGVM